jgi:O-methyltransferase
MDNFFITKYFDWRMKKVSYVDRVINRGLRALGVKYQLYTADAIDAVLQRVLRRPVNALQSFKSGTMTNIEQRMNMFHLVSQVLAYNVQGDFVELGCHEGRSSILIQKTYNRV